MQEDPRTGAVDVSVIGVRHQDREPFWHRRIDAILYQEIKRMTMNNTDTGLNADSAAFRKTLGKS